MNLRILMIISAVVTAAFGLAFVLAPDQVSTQYGIETSVELEYLARLLGAAFIGFAVLTWTARNANDSTARRAIVLALFIGDTAGFVVALIGQLDEVPNSLGWSTVAIYLLFALGFGYFQFVKPAPKEVPHTAS